METIVVDEVLARMRQLTLDLTIIRAAISKQVLRIEKSCSSEWLAECGDNADVIAQLRTAIDDLRHVVWLYAETAANRAGGYPAAPSKLLARATEIVRALSLHPPLPRIDSTGYGASFIERFLHLMESSSDHEIAGKHTRNE